MKDATDAESSVQEVLSAPDPASKKDAPIAKFNFLFPFLAVPVVIVFWALCMATGDYFESGTFDFAKSVWASLVVIGSMIGIGIGLQLLAFIVELGPAYRRTFLIFACIFLSAVMHKFIWTQSTTLSGVAIFCGVGLVICCLLIALISTIDIKR
jgi:hypothetical protein